MESLTGKPAAARLIAALVCLVLLLCACAGAPVTDREKAPSCDALPEQQLDESSARWLGRTFVGDGGKRVVS